MHPLFKKLTILAIGAALVGGGLGAAVGATTASAATTTGTHAVGLTFPGGPGHASAVWAGTWNNTGRGFCLDFGSSTPNRSSTSVITGNLPGMTAEESKQAKFVANKYSATTSKETAANAGFAVWRYQHDTAFNTWYSSARTKDVISTARHNAITAMIVDARQHAAYKMSVALSQVAVGQTGTGTVTVRASNGYPPVGRLVTVAPTAFSTGATVRILTVNHLVRTTGYTGSTGVVAFTYQRTNTGTVGVKATLTSPSSAQADLSVTTKGHQRTLGGRYNESAASYAGYDSHAPVTITSVCDPTCNGLATVTFKSTNPAGAQNIKWYGKVGNLTVATFAVRPGTTGTGTATLTDGTRITSSAYCYTGSVFNGPCTTGGVGVATPFEVVCPTWPLATIITPCNCTLNLPVSATFTAPAGSPRFYRAFVRVNTGTPIVRDLVNGTPLTISTPKLTAHSVVVVNFEVYRDEAHTILLGSHILKTVTVY